MFCLKQVFQGGFLGVEFICCAWVNVQVHILLVLHVGINIGVARARAGKVNRITHIGSGADVDPGVVGQVVIEVELRIGRDGEAPGESNSPADMTAAAVSLLPRSFR